MINIIIFVIVMIFLISILGTITFIINIITISSIIQYNYFYGYKEYHHCLNSPFWHVLVD